MIEELKIEENHKGFLFLYDAKNHQRPMVSPHRHKELELNIVIRGYGEYFLANRKYKLTPGNLVWLFPGQEHQLAKTDPDFIMYVVVFKESLFHQMAPKYRPLFEKNPGGSFCRKISLTSLEKLEKICRSICEISPDNEIPSPAYHYAGQAFGFKENASFQHSDPFLLNAGLSYLLAMGWHLFITEGIKEHREKLNPVVKKAISILKESQEVDKGLQDLALECGVSASRLSRLFNEQTGLSIVDYKNRLKLELLIECLELNPHYNISEVCYQVGFGSYSQFYKIFQKHFGISPKAYFSR